MIFNKICGIILIIILENVWSSNKVDFIKDYLILNKDINFLEAHLCWNEGEIKQLSRELSKLEVRFALLKSETIVLKPNIHNRVFVTDMNCSFFHTMMQEVLLKELYKFPNKWIIFGDEKKLENSNYYYPVNSYIILVDDISTNTTFEIKSLYKLNPSTAKYYRNDIGKWSADKGFSFFNELVLIRNRSDFMGMPLRVSYVFLDNNSLLHLTDNRDVHIDKLTKINYIMYRIFIDIWNMTQIKLIRSDWGLNPHPTKLYYKGMLGDLYYGRADISGTLSFTPVERLKYFKYLVATANGLDGIFVFRAPPLSYSTNMFALPFDKYVWMGCGILVILCCVTIRIILQWEETEKLFIEARKGGNENPPNSLDVVMMQIAVVCQMDYFYEPKSTSGKIATFTLLLSFSYIYTAFSARIVLLLQSSSNNLKDVKGLYDAKMDMGVEDIPYNRYYFTQPAKRTNEYLRKLIYENKIAGKGSADGNFYHTQKGISLVQTSYFAFHVEKTTANNLIEALFSNEEKCSVRSVETIFKSDVAHISCPKNSTYVEYFLVGFRKLFETGLHEREHKKIFIKGPLKCIGKGSIFVSVGLVECYFAFEIFIIGVCLSFLVFLIEIISDFHIKNRNLIRKIRVKPFLDHIKYIDQSPKEL